VHTKDRSGTDTSHGPLADKLASCLVSVNTAPTQLAVVLVELKDPDGRRWMRALKLLLDAGRMAEGQDQE
jgi:hypothetical protein